MSDNKYADDGFADDKVSADESDYESEEDYELDDGFNEVAEESKPRSPAKKKVATHKEGAQQRFPHPPRSPLSTRFPHPPRSPLSIRFPHPPRSSLSTPPSRSQ
jgi:hypothetical protein